MARNTPDEKAAGAPEWMVTYGDMMTLLLCFFVMLVALSEVKTDKFLRVLESLRRAFGYSAARAPMPGGNSQGNSPFDRTAYYELIRGVHGRKSLSDRRGAAGPYEKSTTVREGTRSVVGTRIFFARGSAELSAEARRALAEIADLLRGHPNKVEVRGHASRQPLPADCPYRDKRDLAYARARNTAARMLADSSSPNAATVSQPRTVTSPRIAMLR